MKLTDQEQAMLEGKEGRAKQKAMDLLVRYGEALGAERRVATNNVCGRYPTFCIRTRPPPSGRYDRATVPVFVVVAKVPDSKSLTRTPSIASPESWSYTPTIRT